jgi:hypothetical protein
VSFSCDVNVLLYASDASSPVHNLVPDAHLAALLKQHDVRTLYTRDFRKFSFLEVRDPLGE